MDGNHKTMLTVLVSLEAVNGASQSYSKLPGATPESFSLSNDYLNRASV